MSPAGTPPPVTSDAAVQTLNASSTSRSSTCSGAQGSALATTKTVSTQNSSWMLLPKQMSEPGGSACMEVVRWPASIVCLQLL
jgi:hypothetical protein